MASVLELILRSRKEGDAAKKTEKELKEVKRTSDETAKSFNLLNKALTALAGGTVLFIASATKLAARVEMLGVVTVQLGKTAGMTEEEIRNLERAIQDQGITTQASRVALSRMIQANIDLAHSTDLARLSQDAAVIAGINSSEAFQHLINVIVTGNIRMGRTIGLQLQFGKALRSTAEQLGKNAEELTEQEIIQSRTNEVLRQGVAIADTYEAAMETAGKQMLSMDRQIEEIRVAIGEVFLPVLTEAVEILYDAAKAINELVKAGKDLQKQEKDLARDIIKTGGSYEDLRKQLEPLVEEQGKYLYTQEELMDTLPNVVSAFEMMGEGYRGMNKEHFEALRLAEHYQGVLSGYRYTAEDVAAAMKWMEDATDDTTTATKQFAKAAGGAQAAVDRVKSATSSFWSVLGEGPGVISALESNLKAIDYAEAGALAIEKTREGVERAAAAGVITQEQADTMFAELYTAAQQIEVELGNITAYEAAKNIRDNVGTPIGEARTAVENLETDLLALVQEELVLKIRIEYIGEPTGFQRGGSFVVRGPSGPDRVPVHFMATAGEQVTVTPAGQTFHQEDQRQTHLFQGAQMNFNRELDEDVLLEQIRRIAS